jgi:acetylornithine deacetylase/succinyl-diaminopimelate desuccinylase-like protein
MPHPSLPAVAARARDGVPAAIDALCGYLRIPAISCDPDHAPDVRRLAEAVRADLDALGFATQLRELDGALPLVAARGPHVPGTPTVLVYGHLDLQPVKGEVWTSPPHVPTVRDGRLYARGAADDMGGWVSHLAAVRAWLDGAGTLPCNLRLVLESEEEIGSPNLERYMDAFPEDFAADVMILTDCENPSPDIPGLTTSLRGLLECTVRCTGLEVDVHSGLWGGMAPDASTALVTLLGRLWDEDGRLRAPRADVPEDWARAAWNVPITTGTVRAGAHCAHGVEPLDPRGQAPAEHLWRQPSITLVATTLPTAERKKNAIRASAEATLSIRVAPGQSDESVKDVITTTLTQAPPGGVRVDVRWSERPSGAWLYTPRGPAFAAADRAYRAAWGHPLLEVGVGGSIPFVALFGRRFADLPLVLNGVIDPMTTAHGPDESLHLGIFEKAILANVHLYAELAAVL